MYIFSGREEKNCLFRWNNEISGPVVEPENIQAFISALEKLSIDFYSSRLQKFRMGSEKDCLLTGRRVEGVDYTIVTVYSSADHPSLVKWLSLRVLDRVLEWQTNGRTDAEALKGILSSYLSKWVYKRNLLKIVLSILMNVLVLPLVIYLAYYVFGSENELIVIPIVIAAVLFSCTAFVTGGRTRAVLVNLSIPMIAVGYLFVLPLLGYSELANPLSAGTLLLFSFVLSPISGIIGGYASERMLLTGTRKNRLEEPK